MNDFIKKHFLPDRFALTSELHGWLEPQINVCVCVKLRCQLECVTAVQSVCVFEFSNFAALKHKIKDFFKHVLPAIEDNLGSHKTSNKR